MISLQSFAEELVKLATNSEIVRARRGAPKSRSGSRPIRVSTLLKKESSVPGAVVNALHLNDRGFLAGLGLAGAGIYGANALKNKYELHKKERSIIQNLRDQGYFSNPDAGVENA